MGKVEIAGASPIEPRALLKEGDFKTGDVANFDRVNEGLERMRKAVRRGGYLRVKITSDRNIDDARKAVDVAVRIEPGAQYLMGKLHIVGLDLVGEAEVLRIWTLKEGKPFNADYPEYFLQQVKEQGLFDGLGKTRAANTVDEQNHIVDVTLYFGAAEEAAPGAFRRRQQ